MVQRGQGLPLVPKTVNNFGGVKAWPQHFDSHALAELFVIALAQIYHRHPAFTEFPNNLVGADPLSSPSSRFERKPAGGGGILEQGIGLVVMCEERLHFGEQGSIGSASLADKPGPLVRAHLDSGGQDLSYLIPGRLQNPPACRPNSLVARALARPWRRSNCA